MSIRRRTVLQGMLATTAAVAMPAVARAQGAPFKLGLMTVKTGPLAQGGIQMEQGIATFLKEKNGAFGSRKVELLVADTGGNPAGAKTKAQELIERDKVDVILGPLAAFELLAITDYVREHQRPMLSLAAAEDVTQRKVNPWVIRPAASSEQCSAFQRVFEDTGGKIVKKLWPPLVTPDYTPYIAQIGDVDGVFNGFAGSNPVKFMRSYADLGLKAKIPLTAGWTALDDALLKSVGDEAVGVISASYYTADHDSPSNKRFVAAMAKDYGVLPGAYSAAMYVAGQCVEAALAKTGGKSDDKKALSDALHGLSLEDTPRGPVAFDEGGNVVGSVFVRRCERKGGSLVNTTIKTYPKVSQFWTYPPAEYLKQPVYSRDYPPAKNLQ